MKSATPGPQSLPVDHHCAHSAVSPQRCWRRIRTVAAGLLTTVVLITGQSSVAISGGAAPTISIAQTPLTVMIPSHPQIVLALGNSQSMDGNLSGAVMTGSGSLAGAVGTSLANSSSPTSYTVPANFSPPVNPGTAGQAPYTVNVSGVLEDNSASRLNVAKAGISAILGSFMQYADFALMDYQTASLGEYTTWVYYMSPVAGFTFTDSPPVGSRYVANPCYNANVTLGDPYSQACAAMQTNFGVASGVTTQPDVIIDSSSDDPLINDVFYAQSNYQPPVCSSGVPSPGDPYVNFGLANYESAGISEFYGVMWGAAGYIYSCDPGMSPTNAGYVPYSAQIMQVERGFGYDASSQSAVTGTVVVPMQSSGGAPTSASVATAIAAFTPYLQPETSNPSSSEIKSVAEQSPIAGLVQGAAQYFSTANPTATNACAPARYIVLVSDGLPTKDLSGSSWPPLGTAAATGYGVTASFNGDGSLNTTNDQALNDAIGQISSAAAQGIKVYVIGLGAGVDATNNPQAAATLTAMAVAGGTAPFFPARSPTELTDDMQIILSQILAASRSNASATVNTTGLNTTSVAYQPSFNTSDTDQDWTGDIRAYPIDPASGTVNTLVPVWSAQALLDTQTSGTGWDTGRLVATWDPLANGGHGGGIPFRWTAGTPASGIAANTALGQELASHTADPSGQDVLNYLRGDAQLSVVAGGSYRNRTHALADIVDSAPLYIGAPTGPYQSNSYLTFAHNEAARTPVLYVGGDDGMLHAFNAATGAEMFAYIPNGVFANLVQLSNPYYNAQHRYYVDGSAQAADVQFNNGNWHTVLVSNERAGGNTVFALDVTRPSNIHTEANLASKVLWEFSDPNMGLGFSTPAIAQTAVGAGGARLGFTVFFGNGYNGPSETPYLYALDPKTGNSLPGTPINLCAAVPTACNSSLPNGLSSVTIVNDLGAVGAPATTLYAGDLQGNVWRVDIHDPNPLNWVATVLLQAVDPSGTPQPITTAPAVSLNPQFPLLSGTMVYVGTGQLLGTPDLTSTQVQTMYAVYDSGSNAGPLSRVNPSMIQQTMSAHNVGGHTLRFVSGGPITLPSQNGWYVDFTLLAGERIVTDPRLVAGSVAVISVQPSEASVGTAMVAKPQHSTLALAHASSEPAASTVPDQVVYIGATPSLAIHNVSSAQVMGGVYYGDASRARLWPVTTGTAPHTLTSIVVTPANPTITNGQTEAFTATGYYEDLTTANLTSQVTWSSSDNTVATINGQGLASSVAAGATTITATLTGISGSTTLTVVNPPPPPPPPTLQSITVTPANQTIDVGATEQYTAIGHYSDGSTLNLTNQATWSTTDNTVATIGAQGLASGVAAGSVTISATYSGVTGSTTLTVINPPPPPPPPTLTSLVVTPANPTIYVGQAQQFTATAHYSDGSTQNVTSLATWSSSNIATATMGSPGLASGIAVGGSTISATWSGLSGSATLTVIVMPPPPTLVSITVTPVNQSIYQDELEIYDAVGTYSNGATQDLTSSATWSSSDITIAESYADLMGFAGYWDSWFIGWSTGTVQVSACVGTICGSTNLTVIPWPPPPVLTSITVTPVNPSNYVGQTQQFTAMGTYTYNGSTFTQDVSSFATWSSSNTVVATIAAGGLATSVSAGATTITATYGGVSGSTTLTVQTPPPPPPPPVCAGGDVAYLMEFNFAGGAFNTPQFNYNGASASNSSLVPANGVLLGNVYASAPVFNSYSGGSNATGGDIGLITLSSGDITSFFQFGFQRQRFSWREIP